MENMHSDTGLDLEKAVDCLGNLLKTTRDKVSIIFSSVYIHDINPMILGLGKVHI